jgi:hypothetical protein
MSNKNRKYDGKMKITPTGNKPYRVFIDFELYKKLAYLLNRKYAKEFTVLTHAKREGNIFTLFDCFIPKQKNSAATTNFDSDDVISLMSEGADISMLQGHMHSHVDFSVYASGTDYDDIIEAGQLGGYAVRIVMNKSFNIFAHVSDYDLGIYVADIPVSVDVPIDGETFDVERLKVIKSKRTTLEDIQEILDTTLLDFNVIRNPLNKVESTVLEDKAKARFVDTPSYTGSHGGYGSYGGGSYYRNPYYAGKSTYPSGGTPITSDIDDPSDYYSKEDLRAWNIDEDVIEKWDTLTLTQKNKGLEGWTLAAVYQMTDHYDEAFDTLDEAIEEAETTGGLKLLN